MSIRGSGRFQYRPPIVQLNADIPLCRITILHNRRKINFSHTVYGLSLPNKREEAGIKNFFSTQWLANNCNACSTVKMNIRQKTF